MIAVTGIDEGLFVVNPKGNVQGEAPTVTYEVPTEGSVTLAWELIGDSTTRMNIYRDIEEGFSPGSSNFLASVDYPGIEFTDSNLDSSIFYYYKLAIETNGQLGPYSTEIKVKPIVAPNQAPTIDVPADVEFFEDTQYNLSLTGISYGGDVNPQNITITASAENTDLFTEINILESSTEQLALIPNENQFGSSIITVTVKDDGGVLNGGIDSTSVSFNATVSPVNDAPRVAVVIDQAISEDDTLMVSLEVVNVDTGEPFTAFVSSSSDQVSVTANSSDLTIKAVPAQDWYGQTEIDVIVSDGQFAQAISFALNVIPVNDAPVIEQIDDLFANENIPLIVDLNFYDVDSELLTVTSFSDRDEVTTIASISSSAVEIFSSDYNGQSVITVIVSDGELSDTTNFNVTIAPTNDAPIISPIENVSIEENEQYTVY